MLLETKQHLHRESSILATSLRDRDDNFPAGRRSDAQGDNMTTMNRQMLVELCRIVFARNPRLINRFSPPSKGKSRRDPD